MCQIPPATASQAKAGGVRYINSGVCVMLTGFMVM